MYCKRAEAKRLAARNESQAAESEWKVKSTDEKEWEAGVFNFLSLSYINALHSLIGSAIAISIHGFTGCFTSTDTQKNDTVLLLSSEILSRSKKWQCFQGKRQFLI